jgi:hypothetical protein
MERKPNTSEEIDLLYFFRPVSNALKKLFAFIRNYIRLLAHNIFLFGAILVLGAIGGYCLRYFIPPAYMTNGIFISKMLPARYCTTLISNLNELRKPGNIPLLANELKISTDAAWQIQGIIADASPKDTFALEKRDSSMSLFKITLIMHDMKHIGEIQRGLIGYLENNPYIRARKDARKKNIEVQIRELDIKLKSLDSLRRIVTSSVIPRSQGQGIILGEPINPVSVYQAEVAYLRERLNMEERLSTMDNIEILQPFFKLNEYNFPDYDKKMKYAFAASFLFALAVIPLIGRRPRKISNVE